MKMALMKRTLLGAKDIATRSKDATRGTPGLTSRSKKLLIHQLGLEEAI